MILSVKKENWTPVDGMELEENALTVVRNSGNYLVLAGPGAGKTELLAQKACFLLQTNTCRFPGRILAISFKRDAAFNLKERVEKRCEPELARRFDSMTFDSFAKQILDRFRLALPAKWAISADYEIITKDQDVLKYYQAADPDQDYDIKRTVGPQALIAHTNTALPLQRRGAAQQLRYAIWQDMLTARPSKLSFKMVMRLAEYLIASNPRIKAYLQETYQHVFLDEFQDSTDLQYGFFKTCFLGSSGHYTAVGDDKQRIMLWAGALDAVFDDFKTDTGAVMLPLLMNFRCAPRLVTLLNHLAEHLLGKKDVAIPSKKWKGDEGECFVWSFPDQTQEMKLLFEDVSRWVNTDGVNPRDICILVKQKLADYAGPLIAYFNQNGIKARDENIYQEVLSKDLIQFLIHTVYQVYGRKEQGSKKISLDFLNGLYVEYQDEQLLRLESSLHHFVKQKAKVFQKKTASEAVVNELIGEVLEFAGIDRIQSMHPAYKLRKNIDEDIQALSSLIVEILPVSPDLPDALDQVTGKDTIPVMTVHKSKGLEYHTVIFIGLEDGAFWNFHNNMDEDKCTFFVALSRAKERVVFTFCKQRPNQSGRAFTQSYEKIKVIFDELFKSGIIKSEARKILNDEQS